MSDIVTQMRTVASHASVRAMGDVHREGHLVGNLLENNIVIVVF